MTWGADKSEVLNRVWQLRPYSYADLALLMLALNAGTRQFIALTLLWFGFLIFLEWIHEDRGRAKWHPLVWVALWATAAAVQPTATTAVFVGFAAIYASKKRIPLVGHVSFLLNGALKTALVYPLPSAETKELLLVFTMMAIRNLAGDFRDIEKDNADRAVTVPIALGLNSDVPWLYPSLLCITTVTWAAIGDLPWWCMGLALATEVLTYRKTAR